MIGDRVGDARVLAVMQRVIAAHDALQFRKLADHAGRQIGFGEQRGAAGALGIGAGDVRGEKSGRSAPSAATLSSTLPSLA